MNIYICVKCCEQQKQSCSESSADEASSLIPLPLCSNSTDTTPLTLRWETEQYPNYEWWVNSDISFHCLHHHPGTSRRSFENQNMRMKTHLTKVPHYTCQTAETHTGGSWADFKWAPGISRQKALLCKHTRQKRTHTRQKRTHTRQKRTHTRQKRTHTRQKRTHTRQKRTHTRQKRTHTHPGHGKWFVREKASRVQTRHDGSKARLLSVHRILCVSAWRLTQTHTDSHRHTLIQGWRLVVRGTEAPRQ